MYKMFMSKAVDHSNEAVALNWALTGSSNLRRLELDSDRHGQIREAYIANYSSTGVVFQDLHRVHVRTGLDLVTGT
jgi:hypothetical protein